MNDQLIANIIDDALTRQEAGESTAEILARYPDHQPLLKELLTTGSNLYSAIEEPTRRSERRSRKRFLKTAAIMQAATQRRPPALRFLSYLVPLAALLIVSFATFSASARATPGSPFYPLRLQLEDWSLLDGGNERRLQEIHQLLADNIESDVNFETTLTQTSTNPWSGDDIPLDIANVEHDITQFTAGDRVRISGRTHDKRVHVRTMTLISAVPTTTPTDTPATTEAPTSTPSPSQESTLPPAATSELLPTPTIRTTPTPDTNVEPTATSISSDDDGNDNGNDNSDDGNDNGDNGDSGNDNSDDGNDNGDNGNDNGDNGNDNGDNGNDNGDNGNDNGNDNSDDGNDNDDDDNDNDDDDNDNDDDDNDNDDDDNDNDDDDNDNDDDDNDNDA